LSNNIEQKLVPIGKILKSHGFKGELKLFTYNENSIILVDGIIIWVYLDNDFSPFEIVSIRGKNNKIVKLKNINCKDDSALFFNKEFFISRDKFPNIKSDNFYINDIIGFKVISENMNKGYIYDVFPLPGGNVIGINYNKREILVPMIDKYIKFFDFENKVVILEDIEEFFKI